MARKKKKKAVIDIGSNTTRLVVADCGSSEFDVTHTKRVKLDLGREIEEDGRISDETVEAAAEAVGELCSDARGEDVDSMEMIVTAPGRQAENGTDLVEAIEHEVQHPVRQLSADEEARFAFAGAVARAKPTAAVVAVVDLGGASTEIAVGRPQGEPAWSRSVDLGALRLHTRFLTDGAGEHEGDAARAAVAEAFAGITPPLPGAALVVGGSARALGKVVGPELGEGELAAAIALLPACSLDELVERYDVSKSRAPLLLAAALILAEVQRRLVVPLRVSEGGVREGALVLDESDEAAA
jgi:exopolyphosphatase/guanosine-5'-triphosphate,3'-diphosphate pyrophosphatase